MSFIDVLRTAIFALRGNWMRSALTSLGVIIGIAAVIVMVSVGQGTQAEIDRQLAGLGAQKLDIGPQGSRNMGGVRMSASSFFTLTEGDIEAIREEILALFKRLRDEGHTVVLITHDAHVAAHADRICVMHDGQLREASHAEVAA